MQELIKKKIVDDIAKQGLMNFTQVCIKIPSNFVFQPFEYYADRLLYRLVNFHNNLIKNLMNKSFHDLDIIITENNSENNSNNSFKLMQINSMIGKENNVLNFYICTESLMKSLDRKYSESLYRYSPLQKINIDFTDYQNITRESIYKIIMTCQLFDELSVWDMVNELKEVSSLKPDTIKSSVLPLIFGFEKGKYDYFQPVEGLVQKFMIDFLKCSSMGFFEKRRVKMIAEGSIQILNP